MSGYTRSGEPTGAPFSWDAMPLPKLPGMEYHLPLVSAVWRQLVMMAPRHWPNVQLALREGTALSNEEMACKPHPLFFAILATAMLASEVSRAARAQRYVALDSQSPSLAGASEAFVSGSQLQAGIHGRVRGEPSALVN